MIGDRSHVPRVGEIEIAASRRAICGRFTDLSHAIWSCCLICQRPANTIGIVKGRQVAIGIIGHHQRLVVRIGDRRQFASCIAQAGRAPGGVRDALQGAVRCTIVGGLATSSIGDSRHTPGAAIGGLGHSYLIALSIDDLFQATIGCGTGVESDLVVLQVRDCQCGLVKGQTKAILINPVSAVAVEEMLGAVTVPIAVVFDPVDNHPGDRAVIGCPPAVTGHQVRYIDIAQRAVIDQIQIDRQQIALGFDHRHSNDHVAVEIADMEGSAFGQIDIMVAQAGFQTGIVAVLEANDRRLVGRRVR